MLKVKIYSTPTCPYCKVAREFLKEKNIEFEDGLLIGFDREKSKQMLNIEY